MPRDALATVLRVVDVLESLSIEDHVGGSFASAVHGVPRQTRDADIVADLKPRDVDAVGAPLEAEFYVDAGSIRDAIRSRSSFNLIDLSNGFKVDIFIVGTGEFDEMELERSVRARLAGDAHREVRVKSPEDTIIRKMLWYQDSGQALGQQWKDILGILRIKQSTIDEAYLRVWSRRLGLEPMLDKALEQSRPR